MVVTEAALFLGAVGGGALGITSMFYKVCKPSQIMVRTGLGIKRMEISNSGFVWPFQQCMCTK